MAAKQTIIGTNVGLAVNETKYLNISGKLNSSATEAEKASYFRVNGGVFSNLAVFLVANTIDATGTFRLRVGSADVNLTTSVTASTTGIFVDNSNTDTIATDALVDYKWTVGAGTGTAVISYTAVVFEPATNVRIYQQGSNVSVNALATDYADLNANSSFTATEAITQNKTRIAGTLKKAQVYVTSNASTTAVSVRLRVNTANGNNVVSCTALTTGLFEDTASTDSVVADDLLNWQLSGATTGAMTTSLITIFMAPSSGTSTMAFGNVSNAADGATAYNKVAANGNANATESNVNTPINFDYTVKNLEVYVGGNATTSASTIDLRINSASSAVTVSVTAGTTGFFSDTSNSSNGTSGQGLDLRVVNGGGGTLTSMTQSFEMTETVAVVGDLDGLKSYIFMAA